jgi:hypothetical protein
MLRRLSNKGATIMIHTHQTAPTQFVEAKGIRFAYWLNGVVAVGIGHRLPMARSTTFSSCSDRCGPWKRCNSVAVKSLE